MIERTFQHIPGVGPWGEKDLWARGIFTWADFPAAGGGVGISPRKDAAAREKIQEARDALERRDLGHLARMLPQREHWRLYPKFTEHAAYFDIETDGNDTHAPTVVSVFDADGLQVFIKGRNLDALPELLARRTLWVTFNGSCYDAPMLQKYFGLTFPQPLLHFDLRFFFRRLGFRGGLKRLEDTLGFARPLHLRGANGMDAVLLWRAYQRTGDIEALRFLVEYNLYDAFQLRSLADHGYNLATGKLAFDDEPQLSVFDRGEVLYDVSKLLLELSPTDTDQRVLARVRAMEALSFP